jgi:hypothetical protein
MVLQVIVMEKVNLSKMDIKEKLQRIQSNISEDPAKIEKLANNMGSYINPEDLGDYKISTETPLPGYETFWQQAGNLGGYPLSANELRYLSTHPMEIFEFMAGFNSARVVGSVELNNFYD